MNYQLSNTVKKELSIAQLLFNYAKLSLTNPLKELCGALSDDWICNPSDENRNLIKLILGNTIPVLKTKFNLNYISKEPKHAVFQQIQASLIELKVDNTSEELNQYFDLLCAFINVFLIMDLQYRMQICHVDELEHAKEIAQSAEEYAKSRGVKIVTAILDKSGQLVLLHRMHGSILISTDVAIEKAKSAILMRMPSGDIKALVQPGAEFEGLQNTKSGICILDGGFPMYAGNRLIGGIGISGASSEIDISIAKYAIKSNYLSSSPEESMREKRND